MKSAPFRRTALLLPLKKIKKKHQTGIHFHAFLAGHGERWNNQLAVLHAR